MTKLIEDVDVEDRRAHADRRQNLLTDDDISKIISALREEGHVCRFTTIEPSDMNHAVEFYKRVNSMLDESQNIVMKTIIVIFITGIVTFVGLGIYTKIKQISGH